MLHGESYANRLSGYSIFVQVAGLAHPSPAKAQQFVDVDERSAMGAIRGASDAGIHHFVYISVAHLAPARHACVVVRTRCESAIRESGLNATITMVAPVNSVLPAGGKDSIETRERAATRTGHH